jgi:hypothetical protein
MYIVVIVKSLFFSALACIGGVLWCMCFSTVQVILNLRTYRSHFNTQTDYSMRGCDSECATWLRVVYCTVHSLQSLLNFHANTLSVLYTVLIRTFAFALCCTACTTGVCCGWV